MGLADSLGIVTARDDIYTGVIPVYEVLGAPVESGYTPGRPVQSHLKQWMHDRNEEEERYAYAVAENSAEDAAGIAGHLAELKDRKSF